MRIFISAMLCFLLLPFGGRADAAAMQTRLKDMARIAGARDNALTGYGIVVGLAGTGDSSRSAATVQSIMNALGNFGVQVSPQQISSRNVAAVMLTATLPPFGQTGDKLDVNVASAGDARSLVGGTLLLAPLKAANGETYSLAQGPISVGGYKYDSLGNVVQKNHSTVGIVPAGATIEKDVNTDLVDANGNLRVVLQEPDFTTASRLANAINRELGAGKAKAESAGRVSVRLSQADRSDVVNVITRIENISVATDQTARVVVNERTGTVVAGGNVKLDAVTVTHGDLKLTVETDFRASQPVLIGSDGGPNVSSLVLPKTKIRAREAEGGTVSMPAGTTVADLVVALQRVDATSRDVITILQTIKRAGALHADLIVE